MCLGTFGRLARSLATIYIFARVCILGTLISFYIVGNSSEFPITTKKSGTPLRKCRTLFFVNYSLDFLQNYTG